MERRPRLGLVPMGVVVPESRMMRSASADLRKILKDLCSTKEKAPYSAAKSYLKH
jgi:hypothetical protein